MDQTVKPLSFSGNLSHVQETIFSVMTKMALEHDAINLSQGFPDFPIDPKLMEKVKEHLDKPHHQYAPMPGAEVFREQLNAISANTFGHAYKVETEITVTAGATQALATAIATTIREGDEVILFSPAYDSYIPMIELHGGTPITVKLLHPDYNVDWDQLKRLVNHRTKMIIINSPHNPSGRLWKPSDYEKLQDIVANSNIFILADEVYEHLVFNPSEKRSVRQYPELRKRSFVIGSLGKTIHVTGWKIGYCMAPEVLMREFRKVHQYQVFSVNHPLQWAIADYLKDYDLDAVGSLYAEKRAYLAQALSEKTKLKPLKSEGTYFQLIDYSAVSDLRDIDFASWLCKEVGVAGIPLSPFYRDPTDNKVLRLCFAKDQSTLDAAIEKLARL